MLNKKNIIRLIHIVYWTIILISAVRGAFFELIEDMPIEQIALVEKEVILLLFVMMLIVSMLKYFYLTVVYLGGIIAVKVFYKSKLDITDKKTDSYFRDLLSNNTIGTLGYIRDLKINENDLAATIMSLELKGKIKIEKNIEVVDASVDNLDKSEVYVLEKIKNNESKKINLDKYEKEVINDCIEKDLLIAKKDYSIKKNIIKFVIFYAIVNVLFNILPYISKPLFGTELNIGSIIILILLVVMFFILIISPIAFIYSECVKFMLLAKNPYIRSRKAKEINEKLSGLENYLRDFSMIKSRDKEEIKLWKEYLIYSVIFGMNNDIRDEILQKLK